MKQGPVMSPLIVLQLEGLWVHGSTMGAQAATCSHLELATHYVSNDMVVDHLAD